MSSKSGTKQIKGKHLLVVNTGNRKKRFTLKRLRDLGCNLIILNATENWGSAYASHWILADTSDHTASLRAVKDFFAQHPELGPDGVITFWEDDVLLTARIRDRLGLIGIPYEVARLARDKHLFRAFCHEHGLPAPGHALIPQDANPVESVSRLTYPMGGPRQQSAGTAGNRRLPATQHLHRGGVSVDGQQRDHGGGVHRRQRGRHRHAAAERQDQVLVDERQ